MEYDSLTQEVFHNLALFFRTTTQRQLRQISQGEFFVLNFLLEHGGEALPGTMSSAMEVSSARTAAVLNSLERKGDILRIPDQTDHRRTQVQLTEEGKRRVVQVHKSTQQSLKALLMELGEEDAAEFLRLIRRLVELAQAQDAEDKL